MRIKRLRDTMPDAKLFAVFVAFYCSVAASELTYTNDWAVEIHGGPQMADRIARTRGFTNMGRVGTLDTFYHFKRLAHPRRSRRAAHEHTVRLVVDSNVRWVEQQVVRKRVKRDFKMPTDPLWSSQWYLLNVGQASGPKGLDHSVVPAWKEGYSGKGVVVSILDDGIELNHPDLKDNYDAKASHDYNSNDANPMPRYDYSNENRHGTRCAGEVAAAKNNVCGTGVAYNANIGGVRMLDGDVTDVVEGRSLSLQPQYIDIYSSSWGPDDDGRTVDGPARLARKAFADGVAKGRGGLGSIFVWASGNGGKSGDCCNCDGYTNSIYTLSISSATDTGGMPWYMEQCASTLASTYSSGGYSQKQIVTTDLHHKCTKGHTGTSASAPLAAGIFALALEANPKLTWRDMQHLTVRSCRLTDPHDRGWVTNGAGHKVSHKFGYGIINATTLVKLAKTWTTVPPKGICEIGTKYINEDIKSSSATFKLTTNGCKGDKREVRYLEHVQVRITLKSNRRGSVAFRLTSPSGTASQMLHFRVADSSSQGFSGWPFMTTHVWEENPDGEWTLEVQKKGSYTTARLVQWTLVLHGTKERPQRDEQRCHVECEGGCSGEEAYECNQCRHYRLNGDDGFARCVAACPNGLYGDEESKECLLCHSSCASCTGEMPTDCLSCPSNFTFSNGACIEGCPPGSFLATTPKNEPPCPPCHSSCSTCSGANADQCLTCSPRLAKADGRCVEQCPDGTYLSSPSRGTKECCVCDATCAKCRGGEKTDCLACDKTRVWVEDTFECTPTCPDKYYQGFTDDGAPACRPCDANCETCEDSGPESCLSCATGLVFNDGRCLQSCPPGTYRETTDRCESCNSTCSSCSGPGLNDCDACRFPLAFHLGRCVDSCPVRFFKFRDGEEYVCKKCDASCDDCDGPSDDQCTSCRTPLFLSDSRCVDSCPQSYYGDVAERTCSECDESCGSCDGAGPSSCVACREFYVLENSTCRFYCPEGQYEDAGKCLPCHKGCRSCNGPTESDCLACTSPKFLSQNRCVSTCPSGWYGDNSTRACALCRSPCAECAGLTESDCTKCYDEYYLRRSTCVDECAESEWANDIDMSCGECDDTCLTCDQGGPEHCTSCRQGLLFFDRRCVDDCPTGYVTAVDGTCAKCDDVNCERCVGETTNCTACRKPFFLFESSCRRDCPSGTYAATDVGVCRSCSQACDTCTAGGESNCLTCSKGKFLHMSSCFDSCPNRTYAAETTCRTCHASCFNCFGPNEVDCLSCEHNVELNQGQCVPSKDCPNRQYYDETARKCAPCNAACANCDGGLATDCLSCSNGTYFHQMTTECVTVCPAKHHPKVAENVCEPCYSTCETCSGSRETDCTSCSDDLVLSDGRCGASCPEGKYADEVTRTCQQCDKACRTCILSASNCLSCNPTFVRDGPSCATSCSAGTWHDHSTHVCRPCSDACHTCYGASETCTSCADGKVLLTQSGECLKRCPDGYYVNRTAMRCDSCEAECLRCEVSERDEMSDEENDGRVACTKCADDLKVFNGSCVSGCPAQHYWLDVELDLCSPCHSSCESCEGDDADDCLSCADETAYLDGSHCVEHCQSGSYASSVDRRCRDCDARCAKCDGPTANECTECATRFFYFAPSTSCVDACPDGYYDSADKTCRPCDESCSACRGPSSNACLKCVERLIKFDGQCVDRCPDGMYVEQVDDGRRCSPCHGSCLACDGPLETNCTKCLGNAVLVENKCSSTCPGGFYSNETVYRNETTRKCKQCDESCQTCRGAGRDSCVSCKTKEILFDGGQCLTACPIGYYKEFRSCRKCHVDCRTCSGGGRQDCLACTADRVVYEGRCVSECKSNEYRAQDDSCRPCDSSCLSCNGDGPASCLSCQDAHLFHKVTSRCLRCCSDKEIRSKSARCCDCSKSLHTTKCIVPSQIPGSATERADSRSSVQTSPTEGKHRTSTPDKIGTSSQPKRRYLIAVIGSVIGIAVLVLLIVVAKSSSSRGWCTKVTKYHPLTTDAEFSLSGDRSDDDEYEELNRAGDRL